MPYVGVSFKPINAPNAKVKLPEAQAWATSKLQPSNVKLQPLDHPNAVSGPLQPIIFTLLGILQQ